MAQYPRLRTSRYRRAPETRIGAPPQYSMLSLTLAVTLVATCFGIATWGGLPRFLAGFIGSVALFSAACGSVSHLSPGKAIVATIIGTSCAVVLLFSRLGKLPTVGESLRKGLRGIEEPEHIVILLVGCFALATVVGMFCGTLVASVRARAEG